MKIIYFLYHVCYNLFIQIRPAGFTSPAGTNYNRGDYMIKKEMIAMLLAGGQGSRLGVLTANVAKPAVAFGGIDTVSASQTEYSYWDWYSMGSGQECGRCLYSPSL